LVSTHVSPVPKVVTRVIPNVKLDYHHVIIGVAYDINVSNLKRITNTVGAIEVGVAYVFKKRSKAA
jgi:hypothetical protein